MSSYESFATTAPGPAFRPYSDASPFNQPIINPVVHPHSSQLVEAALSVSHSLPSPVTTDRTPSKDWSHPIYFASTTDPLMTISCSGYSLNGHKIYVPAKAQPAGGGDGHMFVVQPDGWEYCFWQAYRSGNLLKVATAYRQRYDGLGIVTPAMTKTDPTVGGTTASYFGGHAGMIRANEWTAGRITHALFLVIQHGASDLSFGYGELKPGANGRGGAGSSVYPAFKGDASGGTAPMGARFWLDMTADEIAMSTAPAWEKTIAHAVATYGAYFGDTGGAGFSFMTESAIMYTSLGLPSPFDQIATVSGLHKDPTWGYTFGFTGRIPWGSRLRVVVPPSPA